MTIRRKPRPTFGRLWPIALLLVGALSLAILARPGDAQVGGLWTRAAAMPTARGEVAAAVIGTKIYVAGGLSLQGAAMDTFEGYDAATDSWERLPSLPTAVHHAGVGAAAGKVFVVGGFVGQLFGNPPSREVQTYDPSTRTWSAGAPMPSGRASHFVVGIDDKLFVVGGVGLEPQALWVYDAPSDTWDTSRADLPTTREHLAAAASGDKLYVIAGRGFGRGIVSVVEEYDPQTDTWRSRAPLPQPRGGTTAASTADGRIHVTGGEGGGRTYGEHYIYDPPSNSWSEAAPLPSPRHGLASAGLGDRFYVLGGGLQQGLAVSDIVEIWSPNQNGITDTPAASPSAPPDTPAPTDTPPGPATASPEDTWARAHLPSVLARRSYAEP